MKLVPSAIHFLLAQKVNKKGTLPLMLRKGSAGQRTTIITIERLILFGYSFSWIVQLVQL
jgi:hypothetical protein